jgi:hypothetical protein
MDPGHFGRRDADTDKQNRLGEGESRDSRSGRGRNGIASPETSATLMAASSQIDRRDHYRM